VRCPGSPPVVLHIDQARSQVSQGVRRCRIPSRIAAGSALASLGVFRESGRAWGLYVFLPVLWRFRSDVPPPAQAADPSASWPERSTPRSTRPRSRGRDAQSRHGPLPETHPGHEGGGVRGAHPKALPPTLGEGRVARTSGRRATRRGQNEGLYPWPPAVGKGSIASWVTPQQPARLLVNGAVRTTP